MKLHLTDTSGVDEVFNALCKKEMRLHLTDTSPREQVYGAIASDAYPYTLLSFAYKNLEPCYVSTWVRPDCEIILDSGAFTAWSAGKSVNIDDYAEWALSFTDRHSHRLKRIRYINLDFIPGSRGNSATKEEIEKAIVKSQRNADYLRSKGIDAIEVFHQDEPIDVLVRLVERSNGRLIAISPRNDVSTQKREAWLRWVTGFCLKTFGKNNFPAAHGLAVTSPPLLAAFPFYSVDSSTWTQCLRFGNSKASGLPRLPRWKEADKRSAYVHALRAEVEKYRKMAEDATNLWKTRGIIWDD